MLLKPFGVLGEDYKDPYQQSYTGKVVDNKDPDKLKRVKVLISIWDYMTDDQLPWVKQIGDGAVGNSADNATHDVPEIGSEVSVSFPKGQADDPRYSGVETTTENKCSLFDEFYPNTYGNKDSAGNFNITNKETGITVYHHNSGTELQIDKDGSYTITSNSGSTVYCDNAGNLTFRAPKVNMIIDDTIDLTATNINMYATHNMNLKAGAINITGESTTDVASPNINLNATAGVEIPSSCSIGNLKAGNGGTAIINDLIGKKFYVFQDGLLQGEL